MKIDSLVKALTRLFYVTNTQNKVLMEKGKFRLRKNELRSSNGKAMVQVLFPNKDLGVDCVVEAGPFYKLVTNLKGEEITLELDKNILTVLSGTTKAEFSCELDSVFLDKLDFSVPEWNSIPADFIKGLKLCRSSVSADQTRRPLTEIFIDGDKMVATDGCRISQYRLQTKMFDKPIIFPIDLIECILADKDAIDGWCIIEDIVYVKMGDDCIIGSLTYSPDDYPGIDEYFSKAEEKIDNIFVFPKKVQEVSARHVLMQKDLFILDRDIKLVWKDKTLGVYSQDEDRYKLVDKIKLEKAISDNEISLNIQPEFLSDILKITGEMKFSLETGCVEFETENFKHLVRLRE